MEELTPLNEDRLDRVSKHKAVKSTLTKDGKVFALLNDKSVVKIEKGDLPKLPRALTDPPPRNSQADNNHNDQRRRDHDPRHLSRTPCTPTTTCHSVSEECDMTSL